MEEGLLAFLGPLENCLLVQEFKKWKGVLSGFRHETGERGEHAVQDLYGLF